MKISCWRPDKLMFWKKRSMLSISGASPGVTHGWHSHWAGDAARRARADRHRACHYCLATAPRCCVMSWIIRHLAGEKLACAKRSAGTHHSIRRGLRKPPAEPMWRAGDSWRFLSVRLLRAVAPLPQARTNAWAGGRWAAGRRPRALHSAPPHPTNLRLPHAATFFGCLCDNWRQQKRAGVLQRYLSATPYSRIIYTPAPRRMFWLACCLHY